MIRDNETYDKILGILASLDIDITGEEGDISMGDLYDTLADIVRHFDPDRQIAIIWSVEDVQTIRMDLSDEQAMNVLLEVKRTHDCNVGVHWDTLRYWADELYPQNKRTQEVRND